MATIQKAWFDLLRYDAASLRQLPDELVGTAPVLSLRAMEAGQRQQWLFAAELAKEAATLDPSSVKYQADWLQYRGTGLLLRLPPPAKSEIDAVEAEIMSAASRHGDSPFPWLCYAVVVALRRGERQSEWESHLDAAARTLAKTRYILPGVRTTVTALGKLMSYTLDACRDFARHRRQKLRQAAGKEPGRE